MASSPVLETTAPSFPAERARAWMSPLPFLLLLAGVVICLHITEGEIHFNGDEMRHAFTGVFFRDLLVDFPWQHPIRYAYEYYAKYPALGVPHWPPFFYLVEGLFYLVFGVSVLTSRLTLLAFSLTGVYFWYRITERLGPRRLAVLAAFIFPLVPYVLLYERSAMLEIPMIALCLGAIHFWLRFLETERTRDLLLLAAFVSAALLTSQKSAFLAAFIVLHFLLERRFRLLLRPDVWLALSASLVAVLPWYVLTVRTLSMSYERVGGDTFHHAASMQHWLYYLYQLERQLGPVLALLALAGVVWALLFAARRHRVLLLWVFTTYVFYSLIQEKDQRHTMIWIPPMVYFALLAIEALCAHRRWAWVVSGGLAASFLVNAVFFYDRPRLSGLADAARYVMSQPDSEVIYYQGWLNGDFIFHVRQFDPQKRHLVARDKLVVSTRIMKQFGEEEFVTTEEGVLNLFRTWGIRYAVVEDSYRMEALAPVSLALHSPSFVLDREFVLRSNIPEADGRKVRVYRYLGPVNRTSDPVSIPMLTLQGPIRADLSRLAGRPWPN